LRSEEIHHMTTRALFLQFVMAGVLAGAALAQDSVSRQQGLPGDAVSAFSTTEQINTFVVDLTPLTTSWGTKLGIAPILKASKDPASPEQFFTNLTSSQAISSDLLRGVPFPFSQYSEWNAQGYGVNDDASLNNPGSTVDVSARYGNRLSVAFSEFGGNSNNVIGGVVSYLPRDPSRLYVARINAAVNGDDATCNLAQVGLGSIDSNGNVHFRVDDFGTADGCGRTKVTGNNLFRVD